MFKSFILLTMLAAVCFGPNAQSISKPDLSKLEDGKGCKVTNRTMTHIRDAGREALHLDEGRGEGLIRIDGLKLADGDIEFDVKGKNVPQKSFAGIAFHGADENTYEAIYFRPFNFKSDDAQRRAHAIQYVSHPDYTWRRLRDEHPGVYEKQLEPAPDPSGWFHVRVVLDVANVKVFVNDAKKPSLEVKRLTTRKRGWIGFFVGDESDGEFANLKAIAKS